MKYYIAAPLGKKKDVKDAYLTLEKMGHSVTHDWTTHPDISPYSEHREQAAAFAMKDVQAVVDCDVFICLLDERITAGAHIELGVAIALQQSARPPRIYVVGEHIYRSIFYLYPGVIRKNSIEEVYGAITVSDSVNK